MKRVLIITPGGLPVPSVQGGAVQNLIELIIKENEKENKIDLYVTSPYDINAEKNAKQNYPNTSFIFYRIPKILLVFDKILYFFAENIFKVKNSISFRNNFKSLYYVLKISRLLKSQNYDKVIFENNFRNFYCLKKKSNYRKYLSKYYLHLHNYPRSYLGCEKELANCNKILCVSNYIKTGIDNNQKIAQFSNFQNTTVLMNCLDTSIFNEKKDKKKLNEFRNRFCINENEKIIIYAGRLDENKGILELVKAFKKIKHEDVKLMIVGSCFYNMKVKNAFEKTLIKEVNSIRNKIIFTGYIDYEDMPNIYKLGYVSVLPSTGIEGAGLTIIESMICGTPVITTNSGGIPEYTNKKASIILNNDSKLPNSIYNSLIKIIDDQNYRNKLSVESIKTAKVFNEKNYYINFLKCIGCDNNEN